MGKPRILTIIKEESMSQENKAIVEKMNKAAAEGNTDAFVAPCADDVRWTVVGEKTVEGIAAIKEWMNSTECPEPPQFTVDHMVAEGDMVVCSGDMTMKDKDGVVQPLSYCDIYRFRNGRVSELQTFVVNTAKSDRAATA
jgi:ketosteroid isomerase-like protein